MEFKKNLKYTIIGVIALLIIAMVTAGDTVITNTGLTSDTLDTGQGANELYDMDQNVLTSSAPTFAALNTGQGANELYDMDQNVLTSSAPTFAALNTGQGANELYAMDQNVQTSDSPTFNEGTFNGKVEVGETLYHDRDGYSVDGTTTLNITGLSNMIRVRGNYNTGGTITDIIDDNIAGVDSSTRRFILYHDQVSPSYDFKINDSLTATSYLRVIGGDQISVTGRPGFVECVMTYGNQLTVSCKCFSDASCSVS